MDIERLLISTCLRERELLPAVEARIQPGWFEDPDAQRVWEWILGYWREYSSVPTSGALKADFPTYRLIKSDEPLQFFIDELRARRRHFLLQGGLLEAIELIQDDRDTPKALQVIQSAISLLSVETAADVDTNLVETWETRMSNYRDLRDLPDGLRGYPTGFESIDAAISGLQAQQLITLVGLPKSGKSTFLLKMAQSVHEHGEIPLFVGFEMSNHEQEARYDAMVAGIDHQRLLSGRLKDTEMARLEASLEERKGMHPFYLSSDVSSSQTLSGLAGKIEQYHPDVLFVDGVYMMMDEITGEQNTPQSLTNITRGMKRLAQTKKIPIVQTTQALDWKVSKKKGLTSQGIGYSSSFLQDSDVLFGVESLEEDPNAKRLSVLDARSAPRMKVIVTWDWSTGDFTEGAVEEMTAERPLAQRMGGYSS